MPNRSTNTDCGAFPYAVKVLAVLRLARQRNAETAKMCDSCYRDQNKPDARPGFLARIGSIGDSTSNFRYPNTYLQTFYF